MSAVVAVRTERGRLHVARLVGIRYETACHRLVPVKRAVVHEGRDRLGRPRADVAWKHELRCLDCESLAKRGPRELARVAGW